MCDSMIMSAPKKQRGLKLLPHESKLLADGELVDITHNGSTSKWLHAPSSRGDESKSLVYRPMGDGELFHLLQYNELPGTQPYQAIIEGGSGRTYAEKYLKGHKKVDTMPTTVVEFLTPKTLVDRLFAMQHKVEDGAISMGLGNKAGGGLPLFNERLASGDTTFRIVLVKRGGAR